MSQPQPPAGNGQPPAGAWRPAAHGQSWQPAGGGPGVPTQQPWTPPQPPWTPPEQQPGYPWTPPQPSQWAGSAPLPGGHPWIPAGPAPKPSVLPIEPREYHEFLRTPSLRWWRPVLALLMAGGLFFAASLVFTLPAMLYDMSTGATRLEDYTSLDTFRMTPAFFLANNLALASGIAIAGLTQWACFGQRPRWMSAVTGGFRWRWFAECVAWVLPVFLAIMVLDAVLSGLPGLQVNATTVFMIAAVLLTTPLQAAGEEFLLRGLGQRAVASWLPRLAGLAVSTAVTAVVFMMLHGAGDPWLNAFYLVFAVATSVLAWRTGGLEAGVAVHAVNNVVAMALLPFTDFSRMFDRSAGVGSPVLLVQMAIMLVAVSLLLWRAKVRGVVVRTAPGAVGVRGGGGPSDQLQASPMPLPWRHDDGNQAG